MVCSLFAYLLTNDPPPAGKIYTVGFLHTGSKSFTAWKPTGREKGHSVVYHLINTAQLFLLVFITAGHQVTKFLF